MTPGYCIYCERTVPEINPPQDWDTTTWKLLAKDHGQECEWITTRAQCHSKAARRREEAAARARYTENEKD